MRSPPRAQCGHGEELSRASASARAVSRLEAMTDAFEAQASRLANAEREADGARAALARTRESEAQLHSTLLALEEERARADDLFR